MTIQRAQMTCAAAIANLEGKHDIELPIDIIENSTLDMLERRARVLEARHSISLPPANLDPTWDSLAFRICRLQQKSCHGKLGDGPSSSFASMVPDDFDVSLQTLKNFCLDLPRPVGSSSTRPWPKCADDEEMMEYIRQLLCYELGRERIVIKTIPITRMEVYAQIIGLTVKRDTREAPRPIPAYPFAPRPGGIPPHLFKKKACCGCCSCFCHNSNDDASSTNSDRSVRKSSFGFGWLKKLAFWRRSKASDTASISSSGTSTIVDA